VHFPPDEQVQHVHFPAAQVQVPPILHWQAPEEEALEEHLHSPGLQMHFPPEAHEQQAHSPALQTQVPPFPQSQLQLQDPSLHEHFPPSRQEQPVILIFVVSSFFPQVQLSPQPQLAPHGHDAFLQGILSMGQWGGDDG